MLRASGRLPEDVKQPVFVFYGRPDIVRGALAGGRRGRRRQFTIHFPLAIIPNQFVLSHGKR